MGRAGSGVEPRARSIRIRITVAGQTAAGTLMVAGKPLRPTPAHLKYAHRVAAEIRDRLRHGTYRAEDYFSVAPTGDNTVAAALDRWLAAQADITASTRRGYETAIRSFWRPEIGHKPLAQLVRSDILLALARRPDWSGKTRNNRLAVLRPALELAVADGLLASNPAAGINPFTHQKPLVDPFSAEEREQILAHFRAHAPTATWAYFAFMFWSGLRTSEGLGLQWGQLELAKRRLIVSQGLVEGHMTARTKTGLARTVDLNPMALEALRAMEPLSKLAGGAVFVHPADGRPWTREQQTWAIWKRALLRLGIRYRRPYNTRHTYATTLLMAGMTPAYVARQLGHSIQMLLDRYARWLDGADNAREQDKLLAFLDSQESANSSPVLPRPSSKSS